MRKALRLLFNLHHGEEKRALLFLCLGLVWGMGCYGTLALAEGLFIEKLGSIELPKIYLGSSLILCLFSSLVLYNLFQKRVSPRTLFLTPVISTVICNVYLLFFSIVTTDLPRFPLFFYRIIIWSLTIFSYTSFWSFVDQFFNLQDGKRHFCIFNAIIFLGDAIGSGIVATLVHVLGIQGMLILFSIALLLTLPIVFYVSNSLKALVDDHDHFLDTGHPPRISQALKLCFADKYTFYLLCFYFLMQLLAIATEFNYLKVFEVVFTSKEEFHLIAHIGKCALWISLGNMCFALFAYSRIIKNLGINNVILFAPLCFLSLFFCWIFNTSLCIATIAMVVREGVTYALDDNNLQLLIYGVPNKIRSQIRIVIESFIEPIGMLVWSLICFIAPKQFILCLTISLIATVLVCLVRSYYAKAILKNLSSQALHPNKFMQNWMKIMNTKQKRQIELFLLAHLKHPNEQHQTFAFQHLLNLGSRSILPSLLAHMNKLSLPNKLKTLDMLKLSLWAKDFLTLELLKRWTNTFPHPAIATAIHLYFAEHNLLQITNIAEDLYDAAGDRLFAAILTVRRQETSGSYRDLADSRLQELLQSQTPQAIATALSILRLEKNPDNFPILLDFLDFSNNDILILTCKALYTSVRVTHKPYCRKLLLALKHASHNNEASQYLLKTISIAFDTSLVKQLLITIFQLKSSSRKFAEIMIENLPKEVAPAFLQVLIDDTIHNRCRILAAKALCKIDNWLLKKHAYKLVKFKASKALFYSYHKHYIQKCYPSYNLSLLINTLNSNYYAEVNFILTLLGILGSVEDSDILIRALIGKNQKIKAQALESLEKNCDGRLFSLLEPFVNQPCPCYSEKYYFKCGVIPLTLKELLNMMENSPSCLNKLTAQQLKQELAYCDTDFQSPSMYTNINQQEEELVSNNPDTLISFFMI
ncbi:MFS transporter [Candidatus Chlamydia sanziniae]|uniref:Amino acid transporter n=1 Tax=Candidatus Chlamydia sanziniae TaxID=1806891 RepID=A0A1A9HW18_9CHLA|nr:MFS transporter [Candidatus Chlamydia sanziniae]ANH79035.1 amino acid transporter [Candidatus Chlamydia sanziniae]